MILFWLMSPAATYRHCRPYPILAKQVSGMRVRESVSGKHQRCVSESCSTKKGMNHRPPLL